MEAKLRSISNLWQDTWDLFLKHIGNLLLLALIPAIATFLVFAVMMAGIFLIAATVGSGALDISGSIGPAAIGLYSLFGVFILLVIAVQLVGYLAIMVYVIYHEKPLTIKAAYQKTLEVVWKYLGLMVIIGFFTGLLIGLGTLTMALLVGGIANVTNAGDEFFVPVFFLSLVIPFLGAAVLGVYWNFAPYYLIDKQVGIWEAFVKSFHLVRGDFWRVTLRLVLFIVPIFAISIVFSIIPLFGSLLSTIVIPPLTVVYYYDIYRDLVKKLEKQKASPSVKKK